MKALIDGDILRYEIGFGAETGWRSITEGDENPPPFDYVEDMLYERVRNICALSGCDEYCIYLTEGRTFRYDIAKTRPYKGSRKEAKPFHYRNLTAYISSCMPSQVVQKIEADDAIAIEHTRNNGTVICSRDKDLRQVPGKIYSWELGRQPSFGPCNIDNIGYLELKDNKLSGTGYSFFCAQLVMGDPTDNIPGLKGYGPKRAFELLHSLDEDQLYRTVYDEYMVQGEDEEYLLEQGRLLWLVRKLHHDGTPVMWELGMTE